MHLSGECIASYNAWMAVPVSKGFCLRCRCTNVSSPATSSLPQCNALEGLQSIDTISNDACESSTILSSGNLVQMHKVQCQDRSRSMMQENHEIMRAATIVALALVEDPVRYLHWKTVATEWCLPDSKEDDELYAAVTKHASTIWEEESLGERIELVYHIYQRMYIVQVDHPMVKYAKTVIPRLTNAELRTVASTLSLSRHGDDDCVVLAISKEIQDRYQSQISYAILLNPSQLPLLLRYAQSCIPRAQLEYIENKKALNVTALYNTTQVTLCYVPVEGHVEDRERVATLKFGSSCACIRCRFEACQQDDIAPCLLPSPPIGSIATANRTPMTAVEETIRLGHWYMIHQQLDTAEQIYKQVLQALQQSDKTLEEMLRLDVWHALGAIALTRGEFVHARAIWNEAAAKYDVSKHKELSIIVDKLRSYPIERRTQRHFPSNTIPQPSWKSPLPGVHVTEAVLDKETCERVIQLANAGTWTHERHYAVPTNDVPVHTVKPLLDWFNAFFQQTVCPLLAQQFQTTADFFVNDAFCVRYQACETSNHLPIHTDESSHSFVLALNDDYEGGGTYFWGSHQILRLRAGELLSFQGGQLEHGGEAVKSGVRYILAVFLYHHKPNTDRDDCSEDISPKNLGRNLRDTLDQKEVAQDSKRQKTGFSFGFICD